MDYLKIRLQEQVSPPTKKEGRAHVKLKRGESVRLRQIRIPQSDSAVKRDFPGQQVVHPPKGKL